MKLLSNLLGLNKKGRKTVKLLSGREDLLVKAGRKQFKKLQELGLQLPIAAL